ncbi:MAG: AIR synthase-related protein, partial [Clostridiales bacterium]|nr:AIR synthase-related protein [Clostridiales bacterium]
LEGSALIANDFAHLCANVSPAALAACKGFSSLLSVMPECRVAAKHAASAMHDITEGGVLGAAWEIAYREGLGLVIDLNAIPVREETRALCEAVGLDPLRLIGSGSLLLLTDDPETMLGALHAADIPAAQIGYVTESGFADADGNALAPPAADELYKLF